MCSKRADKRKRAVPYKNARHVRVLNKNGKQQQSEEGGMSISLDTVDYDSLLHPNFDQLSKLYPEFRKEYSNLSRRQSFATSVNQGFTLALTRSILHLHFGLHLPSMPRGHLCPPIPNRWNYIQWLQGELLSMDDLFVHDEEPSEYRGIDLGTGASCIYPLLFFHNTAYSKWKMLATDIDAQSLACASKNIHANSGLEEKIALAIVPISRSQRQESANDKPIQRTHAPTPCHLLLLEGTMMSEGQGYEGPIQTAIEAAQLIPMFQKSDKSSSNMQKHVNKPKICFDFCMSNPPFYSTKAEAMDPRLGDARARTNMTYHEGVYPNGGEVGFILDMIRDSFYYGNWGMRKWYTSMIGKKSTLLRVEWELKKLGFGKGNMRRKEFRQGKSTRWGIAWTFRQVLGRSLALKLDSSLQRFSVDIGCNAGVDDPVEEVMQRLIAYSDCMRDPQLRCITKCSLVEGGAKTFEKTVTVVENLSLRDNAEELASIQLPKFLHKPMGPEEGDFLIDICIRPNLCSLSDDAEVHRNVVRMDINFSCYSHTSYGTASVNKFLSRLESEICRTSRQWRRRLAYEENAAP